MSLVCVCVCVCVCVMCVCVYVIVCVYVCVCHCVCVCECESDYMCCCWLQWRSLSSLFSLLPPPHLTPTPWQLLNKSMYVTIQMTCTMLISIYACIVLICLTDGRVWCMRTTSATWCGQWWISTLRCRNPWPRLPSSPSVGLLNCLRSVVCPLTVWAHWTVQLNKISCQPASHNVY